MEAKLRELTADDEELRPFICEGDPYLCQIFLVGLNPVTKLPFWGFWDSDYGFQKSDWFEAYRKMKAEEGRRITPTRRNLGLIEEVASPLRCLETDIYAKPTKALRDLSMVDHRTEIFDYLLQEIRPKAILVYGKEAVEHLQQLAGQPLERDTFTMARISSVPIAVFAGRHLSMGWRKERLKEVGRLLRDKCVESVG